MGQLTTVRVEEYLAFRPEGMFTGRRRAGCGRCWCNCAPHVLRHIAAMRLLHAGVDITVIALWLGHESTNTTHVYLHADLALKERALARTAPPNTARGRYRPPHQLLAFLNRCDHAEPAHRSQPRPSRHASTPGDRGDRCCSVPARPAARDRLRRTSTRVPTRVKPACFWVSGSV